ncbi:uncharacterized protein J4E78_008077 [Alternaria triticimaculans]|uniref:uncharacterized protein n=1 Tax=Alternaria triticimaculans TaxID=297637 RepID=UPI0020C53439|nr:uncharacterized protein J4E78_008077 [Alternaria triticimaculans]KAI4651385.1 hypothetical protein J4E78_008077 [Alternaria triticimaculans]
MSDKTNPTMSTPHLLDLPTEILNHILTPLPTSSLLRFSETSRHARILANANLHTLSLGIAPLAPAFFKYLDPSVTTSTANPYEIWLRIPQARSYEYLTLHNFQSALVTSILKRHGTMLQHLNISIWALTLSMAKAIKNLRALRTFSLRIESGVRYVRGIPRSRIAIEREEQAKAWELLTESVAEWSGRLTTLRLENCDLRAEQLAVLLKETRGCKELALNRCRYLGREMWTSLGEWEGRAKLKTLDVAECGELLGDEAREVVGRLDGLQTLNLYDCQEQRPGEFERLNEELWHIKDFTAPRPGGYGENMIIEVDPDYIF